ncbi:hypothetical protein BGZ60DRAFT_398720 [Tricladium varicosporioides]|nr:hypothetical protein BGZ60DRAFT_398720 [Hymenoscyphus varicosporioides]
MKQGRCTGLSEKVLGNKHPNTLLSVYCLAYCFKTKKDLRFEATALYQRGMLRLQCGLRG